MGLLVKFDEEQFQQLREDFDKAKAAADDDDPERDPTDHVIYRNDRRLVFEAKGARVNGGPRYRWRFMVNGLTFLVMNRTEPFEDTPNIRVQIGSQPLMVAGGIQAIHAFILDIVTSIGGVVVGEKLSRIDMACDLAGVGVAEVVELYRADQFVTRMVNGSEFEIALHRQGRKPTGLSFGKGNMLRVYDKPRELQHDPIKREAWESQWDNGAPEVCTRFEFQLNREFLKSVGIDSIADYLEKRKALIEYLTSDWFRFTGGEVDRTHTTRTDDHPIWRRVREAFQNAWGRTAEKVQRFKRSNIDLAQLGKQVRGLAETVAAVRGALVERGRDLRRVVVEILDQAMRDDAKDGSDLRRRILDKRISLEAERMLTT
ncbi:MAG: hypothetical protein ACYC26_08645 [Phycisphaerales bacterium]